MYVNNINIHHFRNIDQASLSFDEKLNILTGKNGQGKTNTIEAILLALSGKSHRERSARNLIQEGASEASVHLELVHDDRTKTKVDCFVSEKKRFLIDDEPVKRRAELLRSFSLVFFSPEDLFLVKGSPSVRRTFLDESIVSIIPQYAEAISGYYQVLTQKNTLLKDYRPSAKSLLEVYNESMVHYGSLVMKYRIRFLQQYSKHLIRYYHRIAYEKEDLSISYASAIFQNKRQEDIVQTLQNAIELRMDDEIKNRGCLVGPHLDDLYLILDGRNSRKFASQGQQRTIALSMKLALIDLFYEKNSEKPIVLLDDVMSELDEERQKMILSVLENNQTFITCVEMSFLTKGSNAKVYLVDQGRFQLIETDH